MLNLKDFNDEDQELTYGLFFTAWYFAAEDEKLSQRNKLEQLQQLWGLQKETCAAWERRMKNKIEVISFFLDERIPEIEKT